MYYDGYISGNILIMNMSQDSIWIRIGSNIQSNLSPQVFWFCIAYGMTNSSVHAHDILFHTMFSWVFF